MTYEDDKARGIAISVALNNAATVAAALSNADSGADDALTDYESLARAFVPISLELHGIKPLSDAAAVAAVVQAFPNSVEIPVQETYVAPAPAAAPAAIPGVTGDPTDALWQEYFADPSAFYDNRNNKRSPNGADFTHKTKMDGKFKAGLWLTGKRPLPGWVQQGLQQRGIIQ